MNPPPPPPTLPGFTIFSGTYNVMFMSANPHPSGWDPFPLMNIILDLAEFNDGDFEKIKSNLESVNKYQSNFL